MSRTFLVNDGRTVTLPQGLQAGPGATILRLESGAVITLEDAACAGPYARFVEGRKRAGDWREIDPKDAPSKPTEPKLMSRPGTKPRGVLETGAPPKKEG